MKLTISVGLNIGLSIIGMPALATLPAGVSAQAWRAIYTIGARIGPATGLTTAALLGYNAWFFKDAGKTWYYLGSAGLCMGIMPFTILLMVPTNNALLGLAAKADAKKEVDKKEAVRLLMTWKWYNLVRGLFPLTAAGLSLYAMTR